ncbi:MAG: hypothetical protein PVH45_05110, partial [Candidatus Omnitrophota bacterium]
MQDKVKVEVRVDHCLAGTLTFSVFVDTKEEVKMMKNFSKLMILVVFSAALFLQQGCTENREEMEKEIMAHD